MKWDFTYTCAEKALTYVDKIEFYAKTHLHRDMRYTQLVHARDPFVNISQSSVYSVATFNSIDFWEVLINKPGDLRQPLGHFSNIYILR